MTIKKLFKKVENVNEFLLPLTNNYINIVFVSNLRTITKNKVLFYRYEDFESFIRENFKEEADKMLSKNFKEIRSRFHFDNKGYVELFISR